MKMQNSDKNKLHGTGVGSVLHAPAVLLVEARMIRNNVESGAGSRSREVRLSREHDQVMEKILELYADLFLHDGFGSISIEMKFLKKGQKEIIISSGKDYRFVVDWPEPAEKE